MGQENGRQTGVDGVSASSTNDAGRTNPLTSIAGFQIVRLLPYSPAHRAGLVPYFDIITSIDGNSLCTDAANPFVEFKNYTSCHTNETVCFTVFNLRTRTSRDVHCIPSNNWGGNGLLGCSIEWTRADCCIQYPLHIVDVLEGSPAEHCLELKADRDYIIGMQSAQEQLISLIKGEQDFNNRLEGWREEQYSAKQWLAHYPSEKPPLAMGQLLLLVYNSVNNTVKEVMIDMGNAFASPLGISIAAGLLHLIPCSSDDQKNDISSLPVMARFIDVTRSSEAKNEPTIVMPKLVPPAAFVSGKDVTSTPPSAMSNSTEATPPQPSSSSFVPPPSRAPPETTTAAATTAATGATPPPPRVVPNPFADASSPEDSVLQRSAVGSSTVVAVAPTAARVELAPSPPPVAKDLLQPREGSHAEQPASAPQTAAPAYGVSPVYSDPASNGISMPSNFQNGNDRVQNHSSAERPPQKSLPNGPFGYAPPSSISIPQTSPPLATAAAVPPSGFASQPHPFFSADRMPPPLNFPVFPGIQKSKGQPNGE